MTPAPQVALPRQVQLAQRGSCVPAVDAIMADLQVLFPRRNYGPGGVGSRDATLGDPWRRGGTSPGGASFSGPLGQDGTVVNTSTGTYFFGWADMKTDATALQCVCWTPPEPGQERYGPGQTVGWVIDSNVDQGALPILRPATWIDYATGVLSSDQIAGAPGRAATQVTGGGHRVMAAPFATACARTRIIPLTAHCWGSDWDDTEELGMWLQTAAETLFQGQTAEGVCQSSGWVRDEKGTRGLHYVLTILIAAPVIFVPELEQVCTGFGVSIASINATTLL